MNQTEVVTTRPRRDQHIYEFVCMEQGHAFIGIERGALGTFIICQKCGQSIEDVRG